MRTIVVGNTHGLARGKTAVAAPITRADTYRMTGGAWQSAADLSHGTYVDEVNHFGRHISTRGEVVMARSLDGPDVKLQILDIRAVELDRLTDADFQALGYADRADYMSDWGEVFGGRVWLMRIRRLSAQEGLVQ